MKIYKETIGKYLSKYVEVSITISNIRLLKL